MSKRSDDGRSGSRIDGLYNMLSGLGSENDKASYTHVAPATPKTKEELTDLYRENVYVAKLCDVLPKDVIKRGVRIALKDAPESLGDNPFDIPLAQLGVLHALAQAHIWAKLYGGGAVVLGIEDLERNDRQVRPGGKLRFLLPVTCHELKPESYISDWSDRNWGKPRVYVCNTRKGTAVAPSRIHYSRVVRFEGVPVPSDDQPELECPGWGDSEITRCWPKIRDLTIVEQAMASATHDLNVMVLAIRGLNIVATNEDGHAELQKRLLAINLSKSICNAVLIDADEEKAEYLTRDVKGFAELHDRFRLALSAASEIPHTRLFGDSPTGLSTDDKSGHQNWATVVAASQKFDYEPALRQVVDLMMADTSGPTKGKAYDYTVEWPPYTEPSDEEKSKAEHNLAQADALMIRAGVVNKEEVFHYRHGARGWDKLGPFVDPEEVAFKRQLELKMAGGPDVAVDTEWTGDRLRPPTAEGGAKANTELERQLSSSKGNTTKSSAPVVPE